jgi:hypothetical protein
MTAQVVTYPKVEKREGITKVSIDWASTDAGVVVGAVVTDANAANFFVTGVLVKFDAYPDPTTTTPTAAYTFTVKDDTGIDLLGGLGVGSATATATVSKVFSDGLGVAWNTKLTFAGAGMGDAKGGILNLYFG